MYISIVGSYGSSNIGDDAFEDVFRYYLPNATLHFSPIPDTTADSIILGGGGVLKVKEIYLAGLPSYKKPLVAVGVDTDINGPNWEIIKSLPFSLIYLRSREYAEIASREAPNVKYCPDITFALKPPTPKPKSSRRLGVIVSYDLIRYGSCEHLNSAIRTMQDEIFDEVVFIVFCTNKGAKDIEATEKTMASGNYKVIIPKSTAEALSCLASMDLVISNRFHGIIFSTIVGTPFLSIANLGKCSLYCEQERLWANFIEMREANDVKIIQRLKYLWEYKDEQRAKLLEITDRNKCLVDSVFKGLETLGV